MPEFDVMKERNKQLDGKRPVPYAIALHLELDETDCELDQSEREVLIKYGKVEKGITRDIIVPGDMTLHALHYVINQLYGWQNGHLHSFHPYEEDFNKMIKTGKLTEWTRLAGMYFRFPSDDYEDIYWDDDYKMGRSVKNWMRSKYTGPYIYGGTREYYDQCQQEVKMLLKQYPTIEVRKSFADWMNECNEIRRKTGNQDAQANMIKRIAPITDVSLNEMLSSIMFEGGFDELIERLPIYDILLMPHSEQDYSVWDFSNRRILKDLEQEEHGLAPVTLPILESIHYWYDYGDDWNVKITASACFDTEREYELSGYPIQPIKEYRPVCVEMDGLPVCDDVGGIHGYCNMLQILHGKDPLEKEDMREWARSMGWTGRKVKVENML